MRVPELEALLVEFEKEDEVVQKHVERIKDMETKNINAGFMPERRFDITQQKGDNYAMLDSNITN